MEKYWIGFYLDENNNRVKGQWKTSEEEVDDEANSLLYAKRLNLTLVEKGSITKETVEKIAKEQNISISETLSCI
jgi:hypothetical protein